jgi:hypothetical protein
VDVPSPALQRLLLAGLVLAAVAVAIAANWALLGAADGRLGNVGSLSPKSTTLAPEPGTGTRPGAPGEGGAHADD